MEKQFHLFKKIAPGSYPFLNKSLSNIRGEKWKPVPDFEEYYMVSSLGRFKSLARTIYHKNGIVVHKKEQILCQGMQKTPNYHVKDFTYQLSVNFQKEKKTRHFPSGRIVYHCFVEPIDLSDNSFYIICKDGNGLNLRYRNLKKVSRSQLGLQIFEQERNICRLNLLDRKELRKKGWQKTMRPVTQYDLQGKKLKVYPNLKAAAEATGIRHQGISLVLYGKGLRAGKYVWRWGDGPEVIDLSGCWVGGKFRGGTWYTKKVTQYNLLGERMAIYPSMADASRATGIGTGSISRCASGIANGAKGFIWKPGEGPEKIGSDKLMNGKKFYGMARKKVAQYTLDGKYLATYESIRKAAEAVGTIPGAISNVVRGIYPQSKGYCWKYAD